MRALWFPLVAVATVVAVLMSNAHAQQEDDNVGQEQQPMIQSQDGSLKLAVGATDDITVSFGDDTTSLRSAIDKINSALGADAQASIERRLSDMEKLLEGKIDAVDKKVDDLDSDFEKRVWEASYRYKRTQIWTTHTATEENRHGYLSVGTGHVNDVLTINVVDSGCNSGIGISFTVSATYGVDLGNEPVAFRHAAAREDLADRVSLLYKPLGRETYDIFVEIEGWPACNGKFDIDHTADIEVRSTTGLFNFDEDGSNEFENDNYKHMRDSNDRIRKIFRWRTHTDNPTIRDGYFNLGLAHTDHVIQVDVMDSGCASGTGASFQISARWGVDRGNEPSAFSIGHGHESLVDRFHFLWKATAADSYILYLKMDGWSGTCNGRNLQLHTTTVIITPSDGRYNADYEDGPFNAEDFKVMESYRLSDLYDEVDDVKEAVTDDAISAAVNKQLNRQVITHSYNTHTNDPADRDGIIPIGRFLVDGVLHLDVSDVGCFSHLGMAFVITATWGVDRGSAPKAFTFGTVKKDAEDNFDFYFQARGTDKYDLYLKITGWGPCGDKTNLKHYAKITVGCSEPWETDGLAAFEEDKFTQIKSLSLAEAAELVLPDESNMVPLFNGLHLTRYEQQWRGTAKAGDWNTILSGDDLPTGAYIFYISSLSTNNQGGDIWRESYVSSPIAWFADDTNDQTDQWVEEIDVHSLGHANNGQTLSFQAIRSNRNGENALLQFATTTAWTQEVTINFVFHRLY